MTVRVTVSPGASVPSSIGNEEPSAMFRPACGVSSRITFSAGASPVLRTVISLGKDLPTAAMGPFGYEQSTSSATLRHVFVTMRERGQVAP